MCRGEGECALCRFPGGANSPSGKSYGGQEVKRRKVDFYVCADEKQGDTWFLLRWARICSAA
jgi:hypothetical protein